jgi:hypothetical protein
MRNYFRIKENSRDGIINYAVSTRKNDNYFRTSTTSKEEVERLKTKHYTKLKVKKVEPKDDTRIFGIMSATEYRKLTEDKSASSILGFNKKNAVNLWVNKLHPDSYYEIEDYKLTFYSHKGTKRKFYFSGEKVWKVNIQKFFLVKRSFDAKSLSEHRLVDFAKKKTLKADTLEARGEKFVHSSMKGLNTLVAIFPNINYRDGMVVFDVPQLSYKEVSVHEVRMMGWNIGYDFFTIKVSDIPGSKCVVKEKAKKKKVIKFAKKINAIPLEDGVYDTSQTMKMKSKDAWSSKQRNTTKQLNKIGNKLKKQKQYT